jgi:signal transduction histidine kinase
MSCSKYQLRMHGRQKHILVVTLSLSLGLLFLYSGYFPWSESVHIYRDFSRGPAHYEISLLLLTGIIVYASIIFRVRIGIILAVLVTSALVPHQVFKLHEIPFFRPISFGATATLTAALVGTILNRRDQEKEARDIQQSLTRQVVTMRESEKQSLARELHDVVLQKAIDIAHELDELLEEVSEEINRTRLKQLRTDIDNMMEQTRQLVRDLRPPLLDEIGFVISLKELVESKAEHDIEITLSVHGKERRLPEHVETALFRIAEEALTNAKRHSQATRIEVVVEFTAEKVHLQVSDNGVGLALPTRRELVSQRKFGILDMSERAQVVGGSLRIKSAVSKGMSITVTVPV